MLVGIPTLNLTRSFNDRFFWQMCVRHLLCARCSSGCGRCVGPEDQVSALFLKCQGHMCIREGVEARREGGQENMPTSSGVVLVHAVILLSPLHPVRILGLRVPSVCFSSCQGWALSCSWPCGLQFPLHSA